MKSYSKPSVCFISLTAYSYFRPDRTTVTGGGAERQIYLHSRKLSAKFDVHVVVGDYGQPVTETIEGVTLHRAYTPGTLSSAKHKITGITALSSAMRRANADVYVYRDHPRKAVFTYLITRFLGKKWVYNVANDANITSQADNLGTPIRYLFNFAMQDADGIIAQSEKQRRLIAERFSVAATTVPNGYPRAESTLPHNEREYFLWVGRLHKKQKRPHRYLDLAERLPDEQFLLVGPASSDEAYQTRLERRIAELPNVEYLGPVDPDAIHDYYRRAKALINTSAYEGFPNTFLEAWRYATPVLSLSVDSGRFLNEASTDSFDGDFEQFVTSVRTLAADDDIREDAGEKALKIFTEQYALTTVADRYADALPIETTE
ncbi:MULTISPECIES: glycosyltransferase family 4 protein [Halorussus]|uniref:glycosyltransferase family 4 protein n=1 Tax=Halorussus TaxID=1070314 RepID=UPI000E217D07|nr:MULTISPECIES: glycosyltransferase family 4 protein [Halorussus]NHN60109.1 glycosyltransferase family 4 protein [Halorussus sp. JP-T4]